MIKSGPLEVDQELAAQTLAILSSSQGVEPAIAFLRRKGETKIGTIRVLVGVAALNLREAKRAVELSETWNDRRDLDRAFHDSIVRAVDMLQEEQNKAITATAATPARLRQVG